jgi:eukaryotic-like serine/threonine-protein kinase
METPITEPDESGDESLSDSLSHWVDGAGTTAAREILDDLEALELDDSRHSGLPEPGAQIGRYRILRRIGKGGMGAVFAAEQTEPVQRTVALKVVLRDSSTRPLQRFRSEQQTLARLEHRHIARLYDAGVDAKNRPFFVMELVDGENILRYCDLHSLPLANRIRLVLDACAAVHYAHQRGILHRDLKPSNVLVADANGQPELRVIDFGLSLAANPDSDDATSGLDDIVGTPEFMSPEQWFADEHGVDTRSDLYALGVMLYQLLAGALPWEATDLERPLPKQITQRRLGKIAPPSDRVRRLPDREVIAANLEHALRGDLDAIVLKALAGDREARYPSVLEFARDLERYLGHFPVLAAPPSVRGNALKFIRRNRAATLGASFVLVALIGGLITSMRFWFRAERARDAALANEFETRQVRDFLQAIISAASRDEYAEADPTLTSIIRREEIHLAKRFEAIPYSEFEVRHDFARNFLKARDPAEALRQYDLALARFGDALPTLDPDLRPSAEQQRLAAVYGRLSALEDLRRFDDIVASATTELANLPTDASLPGPRLTRLRLTLYVARAKAGLGAKDEAEAILEAMLREATSAPTETDANEKSLFVVEAFADMLLDHGKPQRALEVLDSLGTSIDRLPPRRVAILSILYGLASLRCGQVEVAARRIESAASQISGNFEDHHPLVQTSLRALIELYDTRNADGDAERRANAADRLADGS